MHISSIIEILSAAHLTKFVNGEFNQRGGIFLVAPPGHLKSTIIDISLAEFPDAIVLSDLNVQTLGFLKDAITGGRYSSLGFGEFEKIYERNPASAANLEGHLRAFIEEGFDRMSFQSPQMAGIKARVFLAGGITPASYAKRFQSWLNSGFARRFLWFHYSLANPEALSEAIHRWKKLNFGRADTRIPLNQTIEYSISKADSLALSHLLDEQPAKETGYALLKKIYCVLKWRHNSSKKALAIIRDCADGFSGTGGKVKL